MSKLLTVEQIAEQLQVSKGTIYKWTMGSKIPHVKFEGGVRFDQTDIDKWLKSRKVTVNEYA